MKLTKLTPILVVDAIEPCLEFWHGRLGFQKVVEVPHDDRLGFVLLAKDGLEVMLQSRASVEADLPKMAGRFPDFVLYMDVDSLDDAKRAIEGVAPVVPERETFYGTREIYVSEPGGFLVGFAQKIERAETQGS